jgi:hypothetical protein
MENKEINQEWVDNLKTQPINIQVLELLKVLESNADTFSLKPTLIQFQDLLEDIKIANRNVGNKGDFFQERVDEVMRMRGLK